MRAAAHAMHLKTAPDRVDQRLQRRRVCCLVRRVADASAPATGRLTLSKTVIGRSSPRLRRTCPACSAACPGFRSKSGPSSRSARNRPQPANTITLAPKKLIRTRRASEGSASEPSLARRVSMCKDAKLSCRGNTPRADGTILEPGRAFSPRGDNVPRGRQGFALRCQNLAAWTTGQWLARWLGILWNARSRSRRVCS